jgi:hypothetical protein
MSFLAMEVAKKVRVEHSHAQPLLFQYNHQSYCWQVALQQRLRPLRIDSSILR